MKVEYSKDFEKSVRKLSGKYLRSVIEMIDKVKRAPSVEEIPDCKKLESLHDVYRIRVGHERAFFVIHSSDTVRFEYLVPRGQAYDKENMDRLHLHDED